MHLHWLADALKKTTLYMLAYSICAASPRRSSRIHRKRTMNKESDYIIRATRLSVLPPKEPIFSERCTHITIEDEAAGEFLSIEQQSGSTDVQPEKIQIDAHEWPTLKKAIEQMFAEIKTHESK